MIYLHCCSPASLRLTIIMEEENVGVRARVNTVDFMSSGDWIEPVGL